MLILVTRMIAVVCEITGLFFLQGINTYCFMYFIWLKINVITSSVGVIY